MGSTDTDYEGPPFQKVGSVRPSQMTHTYGVGAVVELPHLSVVTRAHDTWKEKSRDQEVMRTVAEPRLLAAVRHELGPSVQTLRVPPRRAESPGTNPRKDPANWVGIWGWTFPRWLRCNRCNLLAHVDTRVFDWELDAFRPHDAGYFHKGCGGYTIRATPVRVAAACRAGHLDDFPWKEWAHRKVGYQCPAGRPNLELIDKGYAERATDMEVSCTTCGANASVELAFRNRDLMPTCRGFFAHTSQWDPRGCDETASAIMVGASNLWFPVRRTVLSIPGPLDDAEQFVGEHWERLSKAESFDQLDQMADADSFAAYPPLVDTGVDLTDIWKVLEQRRAEQVTEDDEDEETEAPDLLLPEWEMFTTRDDIDNPTFRMRNAGVPDTVFHAAKFRETRRLTRLREVVGLIGFTRIDALDSEEATGAVQRAPLTRLKNTKHGWKERPQWIPVSESLGEGVLILLNEDSVAGWERDAEASERMEGLRRAHRSWRHQRNLNPDTHMPSARFVLLHTLAHLLIHELALDAGYNTASIRERIYARTSEVPGGPMAGVLLYTSAPDAEGTLGGLVALGHDDRLGPLIDDALRHGQVCSTDPFCAEHHATAEEAAMHGAACLSCQFLPETSCGSANRYLDRTMVVPTLAEPDLAFFSWTD